MRYKSFRIRNFKGIKDTTVNFKTMGGANVFAFVGLNESGKTTILEAIHSFSPETATSELLGGAAQIGVPYRKRVPRHLISTFSGDISVEATVELQGKEHETIISNAKSLGIVIDPTSFSDTLKLERHQRFESGDFKTNYFSLRSPLRVKSGKQQKWRSPTAEESVTIRDVVYNLTPDIAYFPTFVFSFPERIYLTSRGGKIDRFYKRVFQDILDYDGQGHTVENDIVRRVRGENLVVPWSNFWSIWTAHDDRSKIQHVMDRASRAVTKLVFGRWNEIFGEDTAGKEVLISADVAEGEKEDDQGNLTKTNEHDVYVQFEIRDGTRRFKVNDRSLGFRWFFAFMMFTQFRVARSQTRPLMFLFDEPASNLHAAAQQKLIDSFPEIAKGKHTLAYTTHSHYMIEPRWLEQTFIVANRSDNPVDSIVEAASLDDESLDVRVSTYRDFVNSHPTQTSYFQPILDRLQVVPSRFDIKKSSIIVEGKSDYYVLRYAAKLLGQSDLPIMPALGAGTLGALAALHIGWGLQFLFVLDGDHQGEKEKARYVEDFGIDEARIFTLSEFVPSIAVIENLLDVKAMSIVKTELGLAKNPTKNQIRRFFQERLASDTVVDLGPSFKASSTKLLDALKSKLH